MELDSNDEVISIKAGQDHTCFLTKFGHVLTCGWGADGQLGQLDQFTVSPIPKKVKGDIEGTKIISLATKGDFVLALDSAGEIYGWGNNEYNVSLIYLCKLHFLNYLHYSLNYIIYLEEDAILSPWWYSRTLKITAMAIHI